MKVILDTNFLLDAIRWKVDVFSELRGNQLFLLDSIILELEKIAQRKSKEGILAKVALKLIKTKPLKVLESIEKDTDLSLLSYAWRGYAIATHDKLLKNTIKKKGGKIIFIKQKKYVVVE